MMPHRAFLFDSNNIVENIIMVDSSDSLPNLIREYSVRGIASIGKVWDAEQNLVYDPNKPYQAWYLDSNIGWEWAAPIEYPTDSDVQYEYTWDSDTTNWKKIGFWDSGELTLY